MPTSRSWLPTWSRQVCGKRVKCRVTRSKWAFNSWFYLNSIILETHLKAPETGSICPNTPFLLTLRTFTTVLPGARAVPQVPAVDLDCRADFTLKANTASRALTDTSAPLSGGRTTEKRVSATCCFWRQWKAASLAGYLFTEGRLHKGRGHASSAKLAFSTWDNLMCFKIHPVQVEIKWKGPWIWIARASGSWPVVFLHGHSVTINRSWRWCCKMTDGLLWQSDHDIQTISNVSTGYLIAWLRMTPAWRLREIQSQTRSHSKKTWFLSPGRAMLLGWHENGAVWDGLVLLSKHVYHVSWSDGWST